MERTLAIVGTRTFTDREIFWRALADVFGPERILITGDAPGTDALVRTIWRDELNHPVIVLRAEWEEYGKSAGPRRNARIVALADRLLAFWDYKSPGTKNIIDLAKKKGIPVDVVDIR